MIQVNDLSVSVGKFSLEEVSFEVPHGEYAVLMGKTGTGKTTLLECLCGLRPVDSGQIVIDDVDVTDLKPAERGIGYVPQDGALFSSMTVREQLGFPLEIRGWSVDDIETRTNDLVELLDIQHLVDRTPAGLSGGERQRVALGRALSYRPSILFLDEPLSALDDETRGQMYELLRKVRQHHEVTAVHITHNLSEASELADRMLRFEKGQIVVVDRSDIGGDVTIETSSP